MPGGIAREDLEDLDIVDAVELASDGTAEIFTGATVTSTTSSSKQVVLSGVDLYRDPEQLEPDDLITLSGTPEADGDYTVDTIVNSTTFTVNEAISDSTGGTCDAFHPPGASKVGIDPTNISGVTATDVQEAMEELSAATGADDKKVQVDAADASYDYLLAKLQAGTNITLTAVDTGGGVKQVKIDSGAGAGNVWWRHFLTMGG